MATRDTYIPQTWKNLPTRETPISAARLDYVENGLKEIADNRALKEIYDDESINLGRSSNGAVGNYSSTEGRYLKASGYCSHAEGESSTASGSSSHAEGGQTTASGSDSHAEGYQTTASGNFSHAEGRNTVASGAFSHAEGRETKSIGEAQHVSGKFNSASSNYAEIVGGGTSDTDRKNIRTLDWEGNAHYAGDVINGAGISLNSLKSELDNIRENTAGGETAKVFDTKSELDEWLAVEGNSDTLVTGQNIYIKETEAQDYWWDGTGLQIIETGIPVATENGAIGVRFDGTTIMVDEDGTIHAVSAQEVVDDVLGGES